ncbi:MAG: TonB-dependent receptor [Pseudomonas sp.]
MPVVRPASSVRLFSRVSPLRNRLAAALLLALPCVHALAADAAAAAAQTTDLDAVKVQAKKAKDTVATSALGARSALDTPFSVTAVGEEEIAERQAVSLLGVFSRDASVSRDAGTDYNIWAQALLVRGLSLDWSNSLRVNGLPLIAYGATLPLETLEQVQLLKGASGFLYGFGAPGGIVNYVTKKPTDEPLLSFDVGYRSGSLFSQHLDAGGRFGTEDRFGYRLNLVNEQGDTYSGGHLDRHAASLALDARVTETLTWSADLLYQRSHIDSPDPTYILNTTTYASNRLPKAIDGSKSLASPSTYNTTEFWVASTGARWQFAPNWSLKFDVGRTHTDYRLPYERIIVANQAGDYNVRLFDGLDMWRYDFAQALLQGSFNTGSVSHELTAGLGWQSLDTILGVTNYSPTTKAGSNLYNWTAADWTIYDGWPAHRRTSNKEESSLFASDTLKFSDRWSLLAGLRHTRYQQTSYNIYTGLQTRQYRKGVTTPTLALLYHPLPDATLYASYVESLEQGTTVGVDYANYGVTLAPLKSKQYEVGGKWERPGWNVSAALFRLERGAEYANSANVYVQDGQLRYQGLELAGKWRASERWTFGASALFLDAYYVKTDSDWLVGRRVEGTARFSAAADVSYSFANVPGLSVFLDAKHWGKAAVYNVESRGWTIYAPGYVVTNLGGSWRTEALGHALTLRLSVNNLFDRRYWQAGSCTSCGAFSPGAPRTYAFNAKIDF